MRKATVSCISILAVFAFAGCASQGIFGAESTTAASVMEVQVGETTPQQVSGRILKLDAAGTEDDGRLYAVVRGGSESIRLHLGETHRFDVIGTVKVLDIQLNERKPGEDGGGSRARLSISP